ncbi:unnamed protein product, partial [Brassica oleracea]
DRNPLSPWLLDERTLRLTSLKRAAVESCRILEVRSFSHAVGLGETFTPTKATEEEAMRNKEKAWERREKRMHEISLLRSIPYSDHQRYYGGLLKNVAVVTGSNRAVTSLSLQEGLKVDFHQLDVTVLIAHFLVSAGDADESSCHISSVAAILDFGFATVLVTQGKNLKLTGTLGNRASEYFLDGYQVYICSRMSLTL